jgi:hypothetical protein
MTASLGAIPVIIKAASDMGNLPVDDLKTEEI